ncbi:MAG: glycosyltransferase family 1 protein [Anaerolineae bacterium]|nr:glycosyltransferase family 4 protein [Thermoflexales bacterium]MDW8406928.1 glycosyltransferase family 1 protein [Anaerolineae bacterium]
MTRRYLFDARVIQDHFPGIARYAYNVLAALPDHLEEDEVVVALVDPSACNNRFDLTRLHRTKLELLEYRAPIFHLPALVRAPAAAQDSAAQHYPYYVRPYLGAARARSITTVHDLIPLTQPHFTPSAKDRLLIRLLLSLAVQASAAILTVSEAAAQDIRRYWPGARDRLIITPEAADPIFTPQPADRRAAVRAKFDLPERFTLYLASNKPHKNLVRLIEAWAILNSKLPDPQGEALVVAGHYDPRYPQAQARVHSLGIADRVRFIGEVSNADMPALYSACTLFVFPSLHEGFGLTPLEAMACGAPVVCSNASSLPEVTGDAALLFDPYQPQHIAEACERVLNDPALQAELRARSLRRAARFTWAETARQTLAVYRQVAGRKPVQ